MGELWLFVYVFDKFKNCIPVLGRDWLKNKEKFFNIRFSSFEKFRIKIENHRKMSQSGAEVFEIESSFSMQTKKEERF